MIPSKNDLTVLIPDGGMNFSPPVINCLSQVPGLKIDILSDTPWAPARFSRHLRNFHLREPEKNKKTWVDQIRQIAERTAVDIILPIDQPAIRTLSEFRDMLGTSARVTPVPSIDSFDIAANKWHLAKHLQQHGLPAPITIPYMNDEQFAKDLPSLTFPVLTKPVEGKGGIGIKYWEEPQDLINHLKSHVVPGQVILQSFVHGHFTGCSVLCREGRILASTVQKGLLQPRSRFSHPEDILMINDGKVMEIIEQLMASLHWSGVANIDLYYDEKGGSYKILEINPRFWGTLLGSMNVSVNFPHLACLAGLGIDFPKPTYSPKPYLGGKGAIQLLTRYNLPVTKQPLRIKDSIIKYFMTDPLPRLVRWIHKFYKWIFNLQDQ